MNKGSSYDEIKPSIGVFDWRDAAIAVAVVSEQLKEWSIGSHFGVSIRGQSCGDLILGPNGRDMSHEFIDASLLSPEAGL